jgi:hypothetical protein
MRGQTGPKRAWASLAMAVALFGLTGCVAASHQLGAGGSGTPGAIETPAPSSVPRPAYTATKSGAPRITRPGQLPQAQRATAPKAAIGSPAVFTDGVRLTALSFSRGTVTAKGAGIVTGSPYIVFSLSLSNRSSEPLRLDNVVVTLQYGAAGTPAGPLYDDVKVRDFSGVVAPGASTTARYAFMVPRNLAHATLWVDTDGTRMPAEFTGTLPQ